MNVVNKAAILISWPRELDMFSAFIENILDSDVVIVVDDFIYIEDEKFENGKSIIELLDGKMEYVLLSEVLGKVKYRILFSTGGQTFQERVTFSSYLKYIYAISIGGLINCFGLSKIFLRIIGRPLTGGGRNAERFGRYPIERAIGVKVVKYPKGLDISKIRYPERQWQGVFDIYLCHSNIDQNLITNKFSGAKCIKIGYTRYDKVPSVEHAKKNIHNEFKSIDATKPLLLWIPTLIRIQGEIIDNIEPWIFVIEKLLDKHNVLIRLHPKLVIMNPKIATYLTKLGFLVDVQKGRNLGALYQSADLVLADYGGPVLSTIYMRKKLILLNSSSRKYLNWRKERMYIDDDVRHDVNAFNVSSGATLIEQIKSDIQDDDGSKRDRLKEQYFGKDCNYKDLRQEFSKLTKELHI